MVSMTEQRVQYEIGFRFPMKPVQIKFLLDYFSRKKYNLLFSHSTDRLSGTLSLDKQLEEDDYGILLIWSPLFQSIKFLSTDSLIELKPNNS